VQLYRGETHSRNARSPLLLLRRFEISLVGTSALAGIKQGEIVQLNRKGFFVCDKVGAA
jgi:hypothetical protein